MLASCKCYAEDATCKRLLLTTSVVAKKTCQMQKRQASKEIDTVFIVNKTKKVSTIGGTQHFQWISTDKRKSVNKIVIPAKCFLNMPATNSIPKRSSFPIHAWQMNWNTFTFDHKKNWNIHIDYDKHYQWKSNQIKIPVYIDTLYNI